MGFLGLFEATAKTPLKIPTGCFSLDSSGNLISSTMPVTFPPEVIDEIGTAILQTFQEAQQRGLGLMEISVNYASMRITARDLHGGALIFLNPMMMSTPETSRQ